MNPTIDDLELIAEQINAGTWKKRKRVKNMNFFFPRNTTCPDLIVPDPETRVQARVEDRDLEFIDRQVNKVNNGGSTDNIKDITCIEFKNDIDKLLNGNHGVEINVMLGIHEAKANMGSWEDDLGSSMFNAIRLGNMLNRVEQESQATQNNDIKRELFTLMDERVAQGLEPHPTLEQREEFLKLYPQIKGQRALGQWIADHEEVGSNNKPKISYTSAQRLHMESVFRSLARYSEHAVTECRTVASWKQTAVEQIFLQMMAEKKKKALIIFYCSTVSQADQIDNTNLKQTIRDLYDKLGAYYQVDGKNIEIDIEYLRHR